VPSRQDDDGRPTPRAAPGAAGWCSGCRAPIRTGALGEYILGEHHRQPPGAEDPEQALDDRHDLPRRRDFHRLAGVEKSALHVDHDERRPPRFGRQRALERLAAVRHPT
jgi:hypothetical protein